MYNDQLYKEEEEAPMESSISLVTAKLFVENLEVHALETSGRKPNNVMLTTFR